MNVIFIRYDWPVGVVDFHYTIHVLTNLLHQNFICGWTLMSSTWYPHFQVKRSKSLGLVVTKHKTSHLIGIYWGTSDFDKLYVPDLTMMSCTCHDTHFGSKGHGDGSQWPVLIFLIRFLRSRTQLWNVGTACLVKVKVDVILFKLSIFVENM